MKPAFRNIFYLLSFLTLWFSSENVAAQCEKFILKPDYKNGKYGAINIETEVPVIPYLFNYAMLFPGNYMLVTEKYDNANTIWGLANEKGELVLPMKYNGIYAPDCGLFSVKEGKMVKLLDQNFKEIFETDADYLNAYRRFNRILTVKKLNDSLSENTLINLTNRKVYFQKPVVSMYPVMQRQSKNGVQSRRLPFFESHVYVAKKKYKASSNTSTTADQLTNILDLNGKPLFDSLKSYDMFENRGILYRRNTVIVTDSAFKVNNVLSYKYENVYPFLYPAKWYSVTKNGKTDIIDRTGKILVSVGEPGQFNYIGSNAFIFYGRNGSLQNNIYFTDGRTLDLKNYSLSAGIDTTLMNGAIILTDKITSKSGMLNANGNIILPFEYNALVRSRNNQIVFVKEDASGYMDKNGKVLFTTNFKGLSPFYEGYAAAAQYDGRPGFPCAMVTSQIDKPSYATLYTFIDSTGKPFPGGYYEQVSAFRDGYANVVTNCVPYIIDKQGKPVMYGKHYLFSYFKNDVALITDKKFKKFGLVHKSGKILAEPIYDEIKTESFYPYPNNITFGVSAYGTNLKAFTVPKIEKGFVTAIIKDKKNYSEQVTKIPVAQ